MFDRIYLLYRSFRRRIINGPDWVYANGEKWRNPLKRSKMKKRKSRKLFSMTAKKVHRKNIPSGRVMRGGIRL